MIDKLVLTEKEVDATYEGLSNTGAAYDSLTCGRAISLATVKKAEPLIRKDERERIFYGVLQFHIDDSERLTEVGEWAECQDVGVFIYFTQAQWQALKATVKKEG